MPMKDDDQFVLIWALLTDFHYFEVVESSGPPSRTLVEWKDGWHMHYVRDPQPGVLLLSIVSI